MFEILLGFERRNMCGMVWYTFVGFSCAKDTHTHTHTPFLDTYCGFPVPDRRPVGPGLGFWCLGTRDWNARIDSNKLPFSSLSSQYRLDQEFCSEYTSEGVSYKAH